MTQTTGVEIDMNSLCDSCKHLFHAQDREGFDLVKKCLIMEGVKISRVFRCNKHEVTEGYVKFNYIPDSGNGLPWDDTPESIGSSCPSQKLHVTENKIPKSTSCPKCDHEPIIVHYIDSKYYCIACGYREG